MRNKQQLFFLPYFLIMSLIFIASCSQQNKGSLSQNNESTARSKQIHTNPQSSLIPGLPAHDPLVDLKIGAYIREMHEDKNGNLWFGTLEKGVARYDGKTIKYFNTEDGLIGNQINGITEDKEGNLWFATTEGVSKYDISAVHEDGKTFTNFTTKEGLSDNSLWSIFADQDGTIWVGTLKGLSRFNGTSFSPFHLPKAAVKNPTYIFSTDLVWSIAQDEEGNMWFATDGLGVCKYKASASPSSGKRFTHFTKKDGLSSNCVLSVMTDSNGNLWFGSGETRVSEKDRPYSFVPSKDGGLSLFNGTTFTKFPTVKGLTNKDIGSIYEDRSGNIWIASKHYGAFRYDGDSFTNFQENKGIAVFNCVQSFLEDRNGKIWVGFSGGLFRLEGTEFVHITKKGPWE